MQEEEGEDDGAAIAAGADNTRHTAAFLMGRGG